MSDNEKILEHILQLQELRKLYECRLACLTAITYLMKKDQFEENKLLSLFDSDKKCKHECIREFLKASVPVIKDSCVCANLPQKIEAMNVSMLVTKIDLKKSE